MGVMTLLGQKGEKVKVEGSMNEKKEVYFPKWKKYCKDPGKFRAELLDYAENKRTSIPESYIKKLDKKVVHDPAFNEKSAANASVACKYMYFWVQALFDFDQIFK